VVGIDIKERAKALNEMIVELRRELHSHPEAGHDLPFAESLVVRELSKLGLDEIKAGQGFGHGVFATLKGGKPGKTLAIRADMDALPITEETGLPFASTNGMMHACGHDAHVAMLLGAAMMLAEDREELTGSVRFIFQPAEEFLTDALSMIESGALENPQVNEIIGLHTGNLWGALKPGQIGWRAGPFMAATSSLTTTFEGKGGHGAAPHLTIDPIVMAAEAIVQLQLLISREVNPFEPVVVTIGQINGGTSNNIIAERCEVAGTIRTFSLEVDAFVKERIRAIGEGVAATQRGRAKVAFEDILPPVINNKACVHRMREILGRTLGRGYAAEVALPASASDDFSVYLQKVPGAYFFHCGMFESSPEGSVNYPHHHPKFDVNESVLWTGAAALAAYALHGQK
jgi:amidohydrolase